MDKEDLDMKDEAREYAEMIFAAKKKIQEKGTNTKGYDEAKQKANNAFLDLKKEMTEQGIAPKTADESIKNFLVALGNMHSHFYTAYYMAGLHDGDLKGYKEGLVHGHIDEMKTFSDEFNEAFENAFGKEEAMPFKEIMADGSIQPVRMTSEQSGEILDFDLPEEAQEGLDRLKTKYPDLSYEQILEKIIQAGLIAEGL